MQIYEQELSVTQADLDARQHVNNVRYVQWVQDIAEAHWLLKSPETIRSQFYWVMISHHIHYKAEAVLGDHLTLKTFVIQTESVKSVRRVEIYNSKTQKLLASSETIWCFMSYETHKPTRIPSEIKTLFS
ncbi:thioesterase family protein [Psychroserpens sp. SPM9]|uniref:acyl-CoA thioesterase n=1 Tax=Psychroserpens sp. SPM9 TaxID=2975598 RepID=UPI0021A6FED6|nr:thioesterase family protein [Psychroserpens sp. SPM9]MDG5491756.1 thioesterase family protein [Psychroserpens sp. SPM9]